MKELDNIKKAFDEFVSVVDDMFDDGKKVRQYKFSVGDVVVCTKPYEIWKLNDIVTIESMLGFGFLGDGYALSNRMVLYFDDEDNWELYNEELPYQDEEDDKTELERFMNWLEQQRTSDELFDLVRYYQKFKKEV